MLTFAGVTSLLPFDEKVLIVIGDYLTVPAKLGWK